MSDSRTEALQHIAHLQAEEARRDAAPPPYRKLIEPREVVDFAAWAAKLRGDLVLPKSEEQAEAERAARAADRREEAAALRISCPVHGADVDLFCQMGARGLPLLATCPDRRRRGQEDAARRAEVGRALERDARADALALRGVPNRHLNHLRADTIERRGPRKQAEDWRAGSSQGLVLAGDTGRGKSLAAAWLAWEGPRLRSGPVLWLHASELARLSLFGDAKPASSASRRPRFTWDDLLDAQLVILDDLSFAVLCKEETVRERLQLFLALASDNGVEFVITANMRRAKIEEMVGADQVLDRLDKWCEWKESGGESFRRRDVT